MLRRHFFHGLSVLFLAVLASPSARAQGLSFDSAGVKIHYEVIGSGEPVVLIHGFAVSGKTNWAMGSVFEKLASGNQVILMDCRGHGRSGKPHDSSAYGLAMVEDVVRLLDHLKTRRAHVVGFSMGGLITLKLAMQHPDRLKSACIGGAAWLQPAQPEAPEFIEKVAISLEQGKGPLPLLERLNPAADRVTQARIKSTNTILKVMNDSVALAAVMRSLPTLSVTEQELTSCKVPTQFLIGTKDPAPTNVELLKAIAPSNFEVIDIPNADHMTTLAAPLYFKSLSAFIQQNK